MQDIKQRNDNLKQPRKESTKAVMFKLRST